MTSYAKEPFAEFFFSCDAVSRATTRFETMRYSISLRNCSRFCKIGGQAEDLSAHRSTKVRNTGWLEKRLNNARVKLAWAAIMSGFCGGILSFTLIKVFGSSYQRKCGF